MKVFEKSLRQIAEELEDTLSPKRAVPWKIVKEGDRNEYSFEVKKAKYSVFISRVNFEGSRARSYHQKNMFFLSFEDTTVLDDEGYGESGMTGKGNVAAVFSTVLVILKYFISNSSVKPTFIFSSEDSLRGTTRVRLYERFVKKTPNFIPGYEGKMIKYPEYEIAKFFIFPSDKKRNLSLNKHGRIWIRT